MILSAKPAIIPVGARWKIHTDGALLGPNPAAVGSGGFTVWVNDLLYHAETRQKIGATNNQCEFFAVYCALDWCQAHYLHDIDIYTDSKLVLNWSNGVSLLKDQAIVQLAKDCDSFRSRVAFRVHWVKRTDRYQALTDFIAKSGLISPVKYSSVAQHRQLLGAYNA